MDRRKFIKTGIGLASIAVVATTAPKIVTLLNNNMKKILVITGSPRKQGNSYTLANAFIKGATEAGHHVTLFESAFKEIKTCIGCNSCFSLNNTACIFKDDFNELADFVMQSDIIVFATPLYWFSYPSKLKAAIDKFYSFLIGEKSETRNKKTILLAVAGDKNITEFDTLVQQYKMMATANKWIESGQILVPNVLAKGDILNRKEFLIVAEELGKNI